MGLDTKQLFAFIEDTQPDQFDRLAQRAYNGDPSRARTGFAERLAKEIDRRGTVEVLRKGVTDYGIEIKLAYFKPAHGLTSELVERFNANRLTITRQLAYEPNSSKSLDLCLLVNGIPTATAELKNPSD